MSHNKTRPGWATEASHENTGSTLDVDSTRTAADLVEMRIDHLDYFLSGYASGWSAGVDEGRRRADDEASARHRRAVQVVHAMAEVPTHDELEGRRRTYRPWVGEGE